MADALAKLLPLALKMKAAQVRVRLGLNDPEEGDEILAGAGAPAPPEDALPPAVERAIARAASSRRPRGSIDAAVETLLAHDGWEPLMEPIVEPILEEAAAALPRGDGLAEFGDRRLTALFARMDDAELVQALRRMGFSARLSGEAGLGEGV